MVWRKSFDALFLYAVREKGVGEKEEGRGKREGVKNELQAEGLRELIATQS